MKQQQNFFIILVLIFISGLLNCTGEKNPLKKPLVSDNLFTIDEFPHEIGTVWEYQIENSTTNRTDNITYYIKDTVRISPDSLFVYELGVVDSRVVQYQSTYWYFSGDTFTVYIRSNTPSGFQIQQQLVFPLEVGSHWNFEEDSIEVIDNNSISQLNNYYNNAFHLIQIDSLQNESESWYSPNIGLVKTYASNFTSKLISYHKPDSLEFSLFPLKLNSSWTYNVYNKLTESHDTAVVTIVDSSSRSSGHFWLFDYPNNESVLENSYQGGDYNPDTYEMNWFNQNVRFDLKFPIKVGDYLEEGTIYDDGYYRLQVLARQSIKTEAGTFENAYYLKGFNYPEYSLTNFKIWIVENIGIVKIIHRTDNLIEEKVWELKSYSPDKPAESFTIDKFPLYNGMTRTYEVTIGRPWNYTYDTVKVEVNRESSNYYKWKYTGLDSTWLEFVSTENNTINFYSSRFTRTPYKSFQFPIRSDKHWITNHLGGNSYIYKIEALQTPAGRFFPCYSIVSRHDSTSAPNFEGDYVCPNIGIVQREIIRLNNNSVSYQTWRLIGYSD